MTPIRSWHVVLRWCALAWLLLSALGCAGGRQQISQVADTAPEVPKQLRAHQVIVTLAPASVEHWARLTEALAQTYNLQQIGAFPLTSLGIQCVVFQIPTDRAVEEIIGRLAADPRIESVQRNHVFLGLGAAYNDPYAVLQYGAQAIRADLAHLQATGKGVQVAVVDTGVETEHPDLHGRIVTTANFVDGGEQTFTQDSHGTAVTGIIAASANNAIGIVGIAPEADIIAVKACWHRASEAREAQCSSWTLAKAVDFVIHTGARVMNLSLAGPHDPLLARLIRLAIERGITVVTAVLEDSAQGPGFPASLDTVIAICASDTHGQVRSVARGITPLAAPGIEILTTTPRHTYDFLSGSSLAAAHVTGVVALLLEHAVLLSPAQVSALLRTTARPVHTDGPAPRSVMGVVDACAALGKLLQRPVCS